MGLSSILFLSFTLVSFGFLILFFLAAGQENVAPSNLIEFPVSIVVASRNNKQGLEKLLNAISNQYYSEYEVIVVDDRSNDGTGEFLEKAKHRFNWLRTIAITNTPTNYDPKKFALQQGIEKAKHDIVLLTDSDCWPISNGWIAGMANAFDEKTGIVLGFSSYDYKPGLLNYFIRFETLWTAIKYISSALLGNPYMGVGRNIAYRKSFFLSKGGYESIKGITGGDDDLFVNANAKSSNTRVSLGKEVIVLSQPKQNPADFLQQKLRHLSVGKFYTTKSKVLISFFNLTFLGTLIITMVLIIKSAVLYWLASFLLVRWLLMMAVFGRWRMILGSSFNVIGLPILDILYLFYYIFTGTRAIFVKKVKWT